MGSREGDLILDPFAGSGTTLEAARVLNRNFIGCELTEEYKDIIEARAGIKSIYNNIIEIPEYVKIEIVIPKEDKPMCVKTITNNKTLDDW
jgi:DNA modification methylase